MGFVCGNLNFFTIVPNFFKNKNFLAENVNGRKIFYGDFLLFKL